MMTIKVDVNQLKRNIGNIQKSLEGLPTKSNIAYISRASGSIAAKQFIKDINAMASAQPKKYHHLYEWNKTGVNKYRLFNINRGASEGGVVILTTTFNQSKQTVPIAKILTRPGKTGKSVTRRAVFKNKAFVMESGQSVSFIAKRNIAYTTNKRNILFRKKGQSIFIRHPGGTATTGSLEKFANRWEKSNMRPAINKSGLFEKLSIGISSTMSRNNFSSSDVHETIKRICNSYDAGERVF